IFAARCDAARDLYQLDLASSQVTFTDLGNPGYRTDLADAATSSYKVVRQGATWTAAPQELAFTTSGIVNAASFTAGLAPGSLFSVFGNGLSGPAGTTTVVIGGSAAA